MSLNKGNAIDVSVQDKILAAVGKLHLENILPHQMISINKPPSSSNPIEDTSEKMAVSENSLNLPAPTSSSEESQTESLMNIPFDPLSQEKDATNFESKNTSSKQQTSTAIKSNLTNIISNGNVTRSAELVSSSEQLPSHVRPAIYTLFAPDDLIYTHCNSWSISHIYKMPQHDRNSELERQIVHQVDYYFSEDNLVKDPYLRMQMNEFGWVPIQLIAGFNRMVNFTENVFVILDALRLSMIIEVQGYKVRRRGDWKRWLWTTVPLDLKYFY